MEDIPPKENQPPKILRFKNPPVVERALGVIAEIPAELFQTRLESWIAVVKEEFPEDISLTEYLIKATKVGNDNQISVVEEFEQEVQIVHRFGREGAKKKRVWSIRFQEKSFSLNLERDGNRAHEFSELMEQAKVWIPRWANHFQVEQLRGLRLHYVNILSEDITPQFCEDGKVHLGKAIIFFNSMPGKIKSFAPPYDCRMNCIMDVPGNWLFEFLVGGAEYNRKQAVHVDLIVTKQDPVSIADSINQIALAHEYLLSQFAEVFTQSGIQSFKPLTT